MTNRCQMPCQWRKRLSKAKKMMPTVYSTPPLASQMKPARPRAASSGSMAISTIQPITA
ncbi:hypothetical protein D3C84_1168140 [compost metagenome]